LLFLLYTSLGVRREGRRGGRVLVRTRLFRK
jgi:hypothetical protein